MSKEGNSLRRSNKSRQGYMGFLTRLCNEIDTLLSDYGNVVKVKDTQLKLNGALTKFKESSATYMDFLDPVRHSEELIKLIEEENHQEERVENYTQKVERYLVEARNHYGSPTPQQYRRPSSAPPTVISAISYPSLLDANYRQRSSPASINCPSTASTVQQRSTATSHERRSLSTSASCASERLRTAKLTAAKAELERKQIIEGKRKNLEDQRKRLEIEVQRRIELATLEAEKEIQEANKNLEMAKLEERIAYEEFNELEEDLRPFKPSSSLIAEIASPPDLSTSSENNGQTLPFTDDRNATRLESLNAYVPQGNLLTKMVETMERVSLSHTLPTTRVIKFSGNSEDYPTFRQRFRLMVESKSLDDSAKMTSLLQFLQGPALQAVLPYETLPGGLQKALTVLEERFGRPCQIVRACVDKLIKGPSIHYNDKEALQRFADTAQATYETLSSLNCLNEMNTNQLEDIILKLPKSYQVNFARYLRKLEKKGQAMPTFKNVVEFLKEIAYVANHPFFSDVTCFASTKTQGSLQQPKTFKATTLATRLTQQSEFGTVQNEKPNVNSATTQASPKCFMCSGPHKLYRCDEFKSKSVKERSEFIKARGLCFNCISSRTHLSRACPSKDRCKECKKLHHTLLHNCETTSKKEDNQSSKPDTPQQKSQQCNATSSKQSALLQVVPITVIGKEKRVSTYALIDSGSDTTMIDKSLADILHIKGKEEIFTVDTAVMKNVQKTAAKVNLKISSIDSKESEPVEIPTAWTVQDLNIPVRHISKDVSDLPHLKDVPFPVVERPKISVLLGTNVQQAFIPMEVRKGSRSQPIAIKSLLGWSILGGEQDQTRFNVNCTCACNESTLTENLQMFWKIETCGTENAKTKPMSFEDRQALKTVEETMSKVDGHYQMGLPWREPDVHLPFNRPLAEVRLQHLKNRLKRNDDLSRKYKAVIQEYVGKGYAKKLSPKEANERSTKTWYLPHHPVLNPNKPGKVRVVFDAAAKYQGTSLNDKLLQGPDLTNNLIGVLIRFREDFVAFTSDIEAMFHQTRVAPPDTDALRFLWWTDCMDRPPDEYKMLVHIFGAKSSPCCANKTLQQIADDNKDRYDEQATKAVYRNFYVDDQLKSVTTTEEAIRLANQLIKLLKEGGYNLTKFMSNSREVLASIPPHQRAKPELNLDLDELVLERALGLHWYPETDTLQFKGVNTNKPFTKRGILSVVSSLYDPLGFLNPFVLLAKIILQELWRLEYTWDEQVKEPHATRWKRWLVMLEQVKNIAIPRCYKSSMMTTIIKNAQLHFFSDASKQGLASASYIRVVDSENFVNTTLVMGKARSVPTKDWSVPRLELHAATMSTRMYTLVGRELDIPVDESLFWSDSMTTLQYIRNKKRRFRPFVAHRVTEILESTSQDQWNYVPSSENPADCGSRGMKIQDFHSKCHWWNGPSFLALPRDRWPKDKIAKLEDDDKEIAHAKYVMTSTKGSPTDHLMRKFSSWSRLQTSVAWLLRFIGVISKKSQVKGPLRLSELKNATIAIARFVQEQHFQDELHRLKNSRQISRQSKIVNLNPVLVDGVMRVGGRLKHAPLVFDAAHPIILPKDHPVSQCIVRFYHEVNCHAGKEHVISLIRQVFWILQARSLVRKLLRACVVCRKHNESSMHQIMADLPKERVTPYEPPFTYTGVDVFGPYTVKRGRTTQKIYGCLFVCFTSRAIHIEDLSSMDTDSFIQALRRFTSNRGHPKQIWSDNGTNFVGAERELRKALKELEQSKIATEMRLRNIEWINCPFPEWKFQPPTASHMSGVWERLVRSVKRAMKAVVGNALVNQETLRTIFADIVTILNSRPLCPVSDDPKDMEALTPSHLLLQRQTYATPPGLFAKEDTFSRKKWKCAQFIANCFWSRWLREYVPLLQQRQKWLFKTRDLHVNDLVLLVDEKLPRGKWLLGRVTKTFPGADKHVRTAEVKTKNSKFVRPITKLCILEESP